MVIELAAWARLLCGGQSPDRMSGSAKLQSVDSSDGDVSLYPPNVHSVQRDEAGTANDLACEHETEDQPVDVPAPESPPSHPQKELEAQSKVRPVWEKPIFVQKRTGQALIY